jgi:hypothetical protein
MPNPVSSGLPNPSSYDTSVVGVVTDNLTGLAWERMAGTTTYTASDAAAYCVGNTLGGHSDWRLPTVLELDSLFDFSGASPAIDTSAFPNTPPGLFWASTSWGGSTSIRWVVDFDVGGSTSKDGGDMYYVRCVRGGDSPPARCVPAATRYQVAGGMVTDTITGLIWQQTITGSQMTWSAASAQCANLGAGFRLPSIKELPTIVDYALPLNTPQVDATAFPNTPTGTFWTSSVVAGQPDSAWTVSFGTGTTGFSTTSFVGDFRCVH